MPREPLPEPEKVLPAYESLEGTVRRIVRDELRPLHELLEELTNALVRQGGMVEPTRR